MNHEIVFRLHILNENWLCYIKLMDVNWRASINYELNYFIFFGKLRITFTSNNAELDCFVQCSIVIMKGKSRLLKNPLLK